MTPPHHDLAIIGAGASGLLVAAGVATHSPGTTIAMIDRRASDAGIAYMNRASPYLLNVRAAVLGADPNDPGGFLAWAHEQGHSELQGYEFAPRALYGDYLRAQIADAEVTRLVDEVIHASRDSDGWRLRLASGDEVTARTVVLALGNPQPRPLPRDGAVTGVIDDPLTPGALHDSDDRVVVVGSGLTAVDVLLTLTAGERSHPVDVVSRGGRFPMAHCAKPPACSTGCDAPPSKRGPAFLNALATGGPRELLRAFRAEVAANPEQCWQSLFDQCFRGTFAGLWQRWDDAQRSRFLRIRGPFDRHRHRMAATLSQRIDDLIADGAIRVHRGAVTSVSIGEDGVSVMLASGDRLGPVDRVINTTAPDMRTAAYGSLVTGLVDHGAARAGWNTLGIDVDADGRVLARDGAPSPDLFALGPVCRGARWETTAIPEVRVQAAALAESIAGADHSG